MKRLPKLLDVPLYYRWLIRLALPFYRHKVKKKSANLPTLGRELDERFGRQYPPLPQSQKGIVWCHAVSLGELNTAYPLLQLFLKDGYSLWITSTTQTGFDRVQALFADELGKTVQHSFVPVDDVPIVKRFYHHVNPILALFVETELWATMLYGLAYLKIPSVMVNARLSQKSFLGYQKFEQVSHSMMNNIALIIAQDTQSAKYFRQLRASSQKIRIANSLKWCQKPISPTKQVSLDRPVWIAGSTHADEEVLALAVHERLLRKFERALLIIVPRHPERFGEVAKLCQDSTMRVHVQSQGEEIDEATQVYLADSMGELMNWYGVSDVALVGGSFVDVGGHNPIEPASLGKPVIMGQQTKNCTGLVEALSEVGALNLAHNADDVYDILSRWFDDPKSAKQAGEQGRSLVQSKQGADRQQYEMILELLS